ncbi:hypothetical protein [Paraburkholderia sp. RL17-337-BIB-A]|uniref:hypothetical protein n=1 Tax=Paraburkholderia sp. RL17-337-BIB-A TaxID=3031636 RepID=UPI0038BC9290
MISRELAWGISIHMTFVVPAVLLALMDLLMARTRKHSATAWPRWTGRARPTHFLSGPQAHRNDERRNGQQ